MVLDEHQGGGVTLFVNHDTVTGRDWLRLSGTEYESSDAAFLEGRRWRQYLAVAFARAGTAIDLDPIPLPQRRTNVDRPVDPEVPGLLVVPRPGAGLSGRIEYWTEILAPLEVDTFTAAALTPVRSELPDWLGRRIELAYSLFHLAMGQANPELKFISLVTAVEALIPDERPLKAEKIVELLDLLSDQAKTADGFNSKTRARVADLVEQQRAETITRVGQRLASKLGQEYDGLTPQVFFEVNYGARSALIHGNTDPERRPTPAEVQRRIPHLQKFVLDLLTVESAEAQGN
ncbi:hypothetical protein MINTM008_24040 [Mycobacterium intracellulare]|nr:hypothetical protein MINTM008_24040 [Mycobacterium intracellulare]BCO78512.1 hypothetical protein MINTM009_22940 [Mycobacterium intracellulare]BCP31485.1 hypothetical protein MINTM026_24550 [Mycobacterium intracellulare]BCP42432.1 hypothetical protein MINTMi27_25250 [Mycobacterium intracellulare]